MTTLKSIDQLTPIDRLKDSRFDILRIVIPRLWKTTKHSDTMLALEIIDGPYKGVVFSFVDFEVLPQDLGNGWVPARFQTRVHKSPADFQNDEGWDEFAREILLAWLQWIAVNDLQAVIRSQPLGGIH